MKMISTMTTTSEIKATLKINEDPKTEGNLKNEDDLNMTYKSQV